MYCLGVRTMKAAKDNGVERMPSGPLLVCLMAIVMWSFIIIILSWELYSL